MQLLSVCQVIKKTWQPLALVWIVWIRMCVNEYIRPTRHTNLSELWLHRRHGANYVLIDIKESVCLSDFTTQWPISVLSSVHGMLNSGMLWEKIERNRWVNPNTKQIQIRCHSSVANQWTLCSLCGMLKSWCHQRVYCKYFQSKYVVWHSPNNWRVPYKKKQRLQSECSTMKYNCSMLHPK